MMEGHATTVKVHHGDKTKVFRVNLDSTVGELLQAATPERFDVYSDHSCPSGLVLNKRFALDKGQTMRSW
jgi:hypothetical protein